MRTYYKKGGTVRKDTGMKGMSIKSGDKRPTKSGAGMTKKGVAKYRRNNPGVGYKLLLRRKNLKGKEQLDASLIALVPQGK